MANILHITTGRMVLVLVVSALLIALSPDRISRVSDAPPPAQEISFIAVGDVLLDRGIARRIKARGMDWPFAKVASVIRDADLAFCNLECPVTATGRKVDKPICFRAHPEYLTCLSEAGFDIVSNANNHALDCGRRGLLSTLSELDAVGIKHAGAGADQEQACASVIMDVGKVKVAILAWDATLPALLGVSADLPGIAEFDKTTFEERIRAAKSQADAVVVSIHWGIEYRKRAEDWQIALGRRMVDAGADLVLGHHPHCTQPVEKYHGGVIAYSLGNFLFDSRNPVCMESMILKCRLSREGVSDVEIIPVRIEDCRPEPQ